MMGRLEMMNDDQQGQHLKLHVPLYFNNHIPVEVVARQAVKVIPTLFIERGTSFIAYLNRISFNSLAFC
jgi:hypothetical protein